MLDKSRPYAEVYGFSKHKFEQDGKLFDQHGNEIGPEVAVKKEAPEVEKKEPNQYLDMDEIKNALDALGVSYDGRLGRDKLHALLEDHLQG